MKLDEDDDNDDSVENEAIKEYIEKENNKIQKNDLKEEKIDNKIEKNNKINNENENKNEKIDLKDNINRIIKVSKKVDIKPSLKNKKLLSFNDEDEEDE